jgi:hypothetical protein
MRISKWQAKIQQYHNDLCPYVLAKIEPSHQQNQRFGIRRHPGYVKHGLVFRKATGICFVYVHQYSDDGSLASGGATLNVFSDVEGNNRLASFECPNSGDGRWWIVCKLDFLAGVVNPINRLVKNDDELTAVVDDLVHNRQNGYV